MEITIAEIAKIVNGEPKGDLQKVISNASSFEEATFDEITFAGNPKYLKRINETGAGVILVPKGFELSSANLITVDEPQIAFIEILKFLNPITSPQPGIHETACVGLNFNKGENISVFPQVVIADNVTIGDRVVLHPGVVLGQGVIIGNDVEIFPNVTILDRCRIGNRVIVHAGTVIGSDGFGFAHNGENYIKIPQVGIVRVGDDVEIGAGNTIDRATFGETRIKSGVKTDNLVHIAHNVVIGENGALAAQVGIAGSVTIGKHCRFAGQAGIAGHITLSDNITVGPQAGVAKNVESDQIVSGSPEMPHRLWLKVGRILPRLPELRKKISELEKRLRKIEDKDP